MSETSLIRAYSGLTKILSPFLPFWLKRRALKGKEDPERQGERFGKTSLTRPTGLLFWMHGASVGETTMLLPLIDKVLAEYPASHILITSGTMTSATLMEKRLPKRAIHQYVPLDTPKAVSAFLDHWKPDAALWAESEIWPNLILETHRRNIPMALVNARMSEKSIRGWKRRRRSAQDLFGCFDVIVAGDQSTSAGLNSLLGREISCPGNLKDAAPALPVDAESYHKLNTQIGNRPVWCAASTHKGEEQLILAAHDEVRRQHPDALLILALRHPERREDVLALMDDRAIAVRSMDAPLEGESSIFLFDTIGEMGMTYSLSDITLVCGSLIDGLMGHNPLEPARCSNAVFSGPHMSSFADSYSSMIEFGAAELILSPEMIGQTLNNLFSDAEALAQKQRLAFKYAQSREAVLERVWEELAPLFPEPAP